MSDDPVEEMKVWQGDARNLPWPDNSVQCVVTSPPYWGQRDYGHPDQIGMEPSYVDYLSNIDMAADELWRVLRDDGTLWLNVGDTYNTRTIIRPSSHQAGLGHDNESIRLSWTEAKQRGQVRYSARQPGYKDKDLMGLPWRIVHNLIARGWYLRCDIIWAKPTCTPENVTDRPRRTHEYLFLLTKTGRYQYMPDAEPEPGTVWIIAPARDANNHTARFPDELVRRCILPATNLGDVVADPFGGSHTTARIAATHGRTGWSLDVKDWTVPPVVGPPAPAEGTLF
jgi:site-specific DNA-methyltransferase (cytosine-N4-specific)